MKSQRNLSICRAYCGFKAILHVELGRYSRKLVDACRSVFFKIGYTFRGITYQRFLLGLGRMRSKQSINGGEMLDRRMAGEVVEDDCF